MPKPCHIVMLSSHSHVHCLGSRVVSCCYLLQGFVSAQFHASMSCYINGHLVTAVFNLFYDLLTFPAMHLQGPASPASLSVLVSVILGDQQFLCTLDFCVQDSPHVVLGFNWFVLFQQYSLSTRSCPSVGQVFTLDGMSCFSPFFLEGGGTQGPL